MLEVKSNDKRQFQMTLLKPHDFEAVEKLPTDDLFDWLGDQALKTHAFHHLT
jgi:hypothetical protein